MIDVSERAIYVAAIFAGVGAASLLGGVGWLVWWLLHHLAWVS